MPLTVVINSTPPTLSGNGAVDVYGVPPTDGEWYINTGTSLAGTTLMVTGGAGIGGLTQFTLTVPTPAAPGTYGLTYWQATGNVLHPFYQYVNYFTLPLPGGSSSSAGSSASSGSSSSSGAGVSSGSGLSSSSSGSSSSYVPYRYAPLSPGFGPLAPPVDTGCCPEAGWTRPDFLLALSGTWAAPACPDPVYSSSSSVSSSSSSH